MRAQVHVTTRAGGVSRPPYDEANLALHVGDDPAAVRANRANVAATLGVEHVQFMQQVHGTDVAVVSAVTGVDVEAVDALVTATAGVAIGVLVADCVPVVLVGQRAVAVAHAGRRGVAGDVVAATVRALRGLDDGPLRAVIGPAVCAGCYEVPAQMRAEVCAAVPAAWATTRRDTPALDLVAGVRAQLRVHDVSVEDVAPPCTVETATCYSHRRDGVTGRFAAVAMLVP